MTSATVEIDKSKCTSCGECIADCPGKVLASDADGKAYPVRLETCIQCGHCVCICPTDAVTLPAYDMGNFPPISPDIGINYETMLAFLRGRRSVRRYYDKPVPKEVVAQLIEAARYAPTGTNRQGCKYTIVYGTEAVRSITGVMVDYYIGLAKMMKSFFGRRMIRAAVGKVGFQSLEKYLPFFQEMVDRYKTGEDPAFHSAPLLIGIYAEKGAYTTYDDCVIAGYHMILAADTLGLGSCINGFLTGTARQCKELRKAMNVPDGMGLFTAVAFGYPAVEYRRAPDRHPPKTNWIER